MMNRWTWVSEDGEREVPLGASAWYGFADLLTDAQSDPDTLRDLLAGSIRHDPTGVMYHPDDYEWLDAVVYPPKTTGGEK